MAWMLIGGCLILAFCAVQQLAKRCLWQRLITTANQYPLSELRSRFHIGLLYGQLHALTEGCGMNSKARHRFTAKALEHALLFPVSQQMRVWIDNQDKELMQGWYAGKHLAPQRGSHWNEDDRAFFDIFDR